MADITKCSGMWCDKKDNCFRFLAKANNYQSYFCKPPIKNNECDMFWDVREIKSK